jgi:hypothetical protein
MSGEMWVPESLTPVEKLIWIRLKSRSPNLYVNVDGAPYKGEELLRALIDHTPIGKKMVDDFKREEWAKIDLIRDRPKPAFQANWRPKDEKE